MSGLRQVSEGWFGSAKLMGSIESFSIAGLIGD
jgi:hypothetical protein